MSQLEPWLKETLKPSRMSQLQEQSLVAKAGLEQILSVTGSLVTWLTQDVIRLPARDLNLLYFLASFQLTQNLKLSALIRG